MRKHQAPRQCSLTTVISACLFLVIPACSKKIDRALGQVDKAIEAFEKARDSAVSQSDAWRKALPELVTDLGGLEGKATGDVKDVITQAKNQASDLFNDSVSFAKISAQEILAKTGVEFRCNLDFAKSRIGQSLQLMIDDLKFWKLNKRHLDKKPHVVCQIVGDTLTLHDIGAGHFTLDSVKLMNPNSVGVFGYNFRREALPKLELSDAEGKRLCDMTITPAYVTQYQLNIDFAGEAFNGAVKRGRVHLIWPDGGDVQDISLAIIGTPRLKITKSEFLPNRPVARQDQVRLVVTVQNVGGEISKDFDVRWQPQGEMLVSMGGQQRLNPGESRDIHFSQPTVYRTIGTVQNTISLSGGDDTLTIPIQVHEAAPPPVQFKPVKLLLFWDHENPTVLHIVDPVGSTDNINRRDISKSFYIQHCCKGIMNTTEFKNMKNMPNFPNISRAERNAKACIRDEHIMVPLSNLPAPVHRHWPEIFDDELWFIVTGESSRSF